MRSATARVTLIAICVLIACKAKEKAPSGGRAVPRDAGPAAADARPVAGVDHRVAGARVAAVPLTAPVIYADHFMILPAGADLAAARKAAERAVAARKIPLLSEAPEAPPTDLIAQIRTAALSDIWDQPPLDNALHALDDAERARLAKATDAVFVSIAGPPAKAAEVQHAGAELALEIARSTGAWILDQATGETFPVAAFAQARPSGFPLDVRRLTIVQSVRDQGSAVFLETRGLERFGVPELFLRGIPSTFVEDIGVLVNAAAQTLAERGSVTADGVLEVRFGALKTESWADFAARVDSDGGSGTITFEAIWSHGDLAEPGAEPAFIELLLPGDGDVAARAYAAQTTLIADPEGGVTSRDADDPELLAARDRARKAFTVLAPRFAAGVPELERLSVKAPFHNDAGNIEWMWVEVDTWKAGVLTGTLLNEPFEPAQVHAGDRVEVKVDEVFDYQHMTKDGEVAGGETNRILEARQKQR